MEVFPGISMDPDVRFGKPCLTGTRIYVATIVAAVAAGDSVVAAAEEYALPPNRSARRSVSQLTLPRTCRPAVRQAS
jgi:Protein of unknown function (DUF433)